MIHASILASVATIRQSREQCNEKSATNMSKIGRMRSVTKMRLQPVSKMSVIYNLGISRRRTPQQNRNWQAEWKQRLDSFSVEDFCRGWRCLDAPEDRMMRSRYVSENFSWMRMDDGTRGDSEYTNFDFD